MKKGKFHLFLVLAGLIFVGSANATSAMHTATSYSVFKEPAGQGNYATVHLKDSAGKIRGIVAFYSVTPPGDIQYLPGLDRVVFYHSADDFDQIMSIIHNANAVTIYYSDNSGTPDGYIGALNQPLSN
ncbi:MAG: hypothetical protein MJA83_02675 [Gammaproteobacteria bacterium]|nr:hypothetical protein [Gammaproteobacteria bacterium]